MENLEIDIQNLVLSVLTQFIDKKINSKTISELTETLEKEVESHLGYSLDYSDTYINIDMYLHPISPIYNIDLNFMVTKNED